MTSTPTNTDIILFNRRLSRKIAGGARAVFDRASLYAREGYQTWMVILDFIDERGKGQELLRRDGILHPAVNLLRFWRDAIPPEAIPIAHSKPPIGPPLVPQHERIERVVNRQNEPVKTTVFDADGNEYGTWQYYTNGRIRLIERALEDQNHAERWRFDMLGRVVTIETFDPKTKVVLRRRYFALGRFCWLDVDCTLSEGRGQADFGLELNRRAQTFAEVVGEWLDRHFAESDEVVCMADGQNVSQHALRAMKHPNLLGISILHNCHTEYPHGTSNPTKSHWVPYFNNIQNVHSMICLTSRQIQDLRDRYPHLPLRVVHHAAAPKKQPAVRRDPNVVVYVGRISPQKQLVHLVQAFKIVAAAMPAAQLHMYGDGEDRPQLEAMVTELGLEDHVTLFGFTDQPESAFASGAVTVMTSLYEGLPLTLTEAMSVGTPFVAYDLNYGPAEVIKDGENGFLVEQNNIEEFASKVIEVLRNPDLQKRMSANSRRVLSDFSYEKYRQNWLETIEQARYRKLANDKKIEEAEA